MSSVGESTRPDRFWGTVRATEQTVAHVAGALAPLGIEDPSKPYRRHQIAKWSSQEFGKQGRLRKTWEVTDFIARPGSYKVEFQYTSGQNGLPIHRVALASAPKDRPDELRELSEDQHSGFAGHENQAHIYVVNLPDHDPTLRYFIVAEIEAVPSTNGLVWLTLEVKGPIR